MLVENVDGWRCPAELLLGSSLILIVAGSCLGALHRIFRHPLRASQRGIAVVSMGRGSAQAFISSKESAAAREAATSQQRLQQSE